MVAELVAGESGFTDTGLSGATEYAYAVFARDGVPNYAAGVTVTVSTLPVADVTAPGPVTGLTASGVSSSSVVLSWVNPVDVDFAGVVVRRAVGSVPPGSPSK